MVLWSMLNDLTTQTAIVFLIVFLFIHNYVQKQPWKNLPPGPPCLPLLGSIPFLLSWDLRESIRKLGESYGEVSTVYLGQTRTIVLNSSEAIKDALQMQGQRFGDRPPLFFVKDLRQGYGIICANGGLWKVSRRFSLAVLREFGLGRPLLEGKIQEEIAAFLNEIESHDGKPFDPHHVLMFAAFNVIESLATGTRKEYHDSLFTKHLKITAESFEISGRTSGLLMMFPSLRHLPGDPFRIKRIFDFKNQVDTWYKGVIDQHKASFSESNEPMDLIDAYLKALANTDEDQMDAFSEEQILAVITDLLAAGTETTSTTLRWALVYLLNNPDVLEKVQAEIDEVLGQQLPTMLHKIKMPYVQATIMEIQRMADVVPFNVPHFTTEDMNFRGHHIPKNTLVLPNLYGVHKSEKYFRHPFQFDPTRFLNVDGTVRHVDHFMPFSVGRRLCLGEGLAKMELFLMFTTLLQRFTPSIPDGQQPPSTAAKLSITNEPPHFHVIFTRR